MQDATPPENRREFLAMAASAAVGMGVLLPITATTAVAAEPATEAAAVTARWLDSIPGKHRQVADWPDVNNGMGLIFTLGFLISTPVGFGVPASDVGAVLVIRHDTIPIVLNDTMWAKYNLGAVFHIDDPKTKSPAARNPLYLEPGGLPFQEETSGSSLAFLTTSPHPAPMSPPSASSSPAPSTTSLGNRGEPVHRSNEDRVTFLEIVGLTMDRFDAQVLAYCQMGNHYHLVLHTRRANLSRLMPRINGVYTQTFNRHHGLTGQLLPG